AWWVRAIPRSIWPGRDALFMIDCDEEARPLHSAPVLRRDDLCHRRTQRCDLACPVASPDRFDRQPWPVDRDLPLFGRADPASLSRHRAADWRLYRGALHLQPADRRELARRY